MARHDNTPPSALRPLSAVPPALADQLSHKDRREVADLGADLQRAHNERLRIGLPGGAPCPPFLESAEAEAPGAARLYVALDGSRFTLPGAVAVGRSVGLGAGQTAAALDALRRVELISGSAPFMTLPPGGTPF